MTHPRRCELCEADRFTHWYHEDDVCWIADCEVCSVPMVVWKVHADVPTDEARAHMIEALERVGRERFGDTPFEIDTVMRQIPEHFHAHAHDPDWHAKRMSRPLTRYTGVGRTRVERPVPGQRR